MSELHYWLARRVSGKSWGGLLRWSSLVNFWSSRLVMHIACLVWIPQLFQVGIVFCNCHIETIPESLNFQFLRLMFLRICPYLLQDDRMGIWNAQKRVGHFIHPRKLWGLALSWSRADLLASAYDCIPYQHCHQNLQAWSSEKIDSLFKRVRTWIQIPSFFFPFSSFQSSGMSSMLVTLSASYLTAQVDFAVSSWSAKP